VASSDAKPKTKPASAKPPGRKRGAKSGIAFHRIVWEVIQEVCGEDWGAKLQTEDCLERICNELDARDVPITKLHDPPPSRLPLKWIDLCYADEHRRKLIKNLQYRIKQARSGEKSHDKPKP
jgi:hypothetical protein